MSNKPDFKYREENFSILMVNAWELLLKAKIIKNNKGNVTSLYILENKTNKDKSKSKKREYKRNKLSNNYRTIGIIDAINKLELCNDENYSALINNVKSLIEVRDNAIHFYNQKSKNFSETIKDLGTASLQNYLNLTQKWFNHSLDKYNFFLMPLSFFHNSSAIKNTIIQENQQTQKFLDYINNTAKNYDFKKSNDFNFISSIKLNFTKSKNPDSVKVSFDPDSPHKVTMEMTNENFNKKYPLRYSMLTDKAKERYVDFKIDQKFHKLNKKFLGKENNKYIGTIHLDPITKKGIARKYYSEKIFEGFDRHYKKRHKLS